MTRLRLALAHASVVSGTPALAGTWPWAAYVLAKTGPDSGLACSGTVVAPNVVLTAAHCVEDTSTGAVRPASEYFVVTGVLDLTSTLDGHVSRVSQLQVYPAFNRTRLSGDAALLVLTSPSSAPAIPLATTADSALMAGGTPAAIAGWGLTDGSASEAPDQLQTAGTVVQSDQACGAHIGAAYVASAMLCAIDAPDFVTGTCRGDSGGPLLARRPDGTWVEIGITSWGPESCDPQLPDVYTRVSTISSWANSIVESVTAPPAPAAPPSPPPPTIANVVMPSAPAPAPLASPPVSTPKPKPVSRPPSRAALLRVAAGRHTGTLDQRRGFFALRLDRGGRITHITFRASLRCAAGRSVTVHRSLLSAHRRWSIYDHGTGFNDLLRAAAHARYRISGQFNLQQGVGMGTLRITERIRGYGTCTAGPLHWWV